MDAITTEWGAVRARASSPSTRRARLAHAIAALERWAERGAEALAIEAASPRDEAWADGAESALADVAARLAELGRWLRDERPRAPGGALDGARGARRPSPRPSPPPRTRRASSGCMRLGAPPPSPR